MGGTAASAALIAACAGETTGVPGIHRTDLLALARFDSVPLAGRTVPVRNDMLSTHEMLFSDSAQTVFLQIRFTAFSIVSVCDTCTAFVTFTPAPGAFGFSVTPPGLLFRTSGPPVVTVRYGRYADFSVHDSSAQYPDTASFAQALDLWRERAADQWAVASGSGPSGPDRVEAALTAPGAYVVAARK